MVCEILNKLKSFGGFLFCIACIISWVVLLAPNFIIGLGLQPSAVWKHGAFISVFGFSIFFVAWVISKARSRYGYKYWDWKSLKIAKIMPRHHPLRAGVAELGFRRVVAGHLTSVRILPSAPLPRCSGVIRNVAGCRSVATDTGLICTVNITSKASRVDIILSI